LIATLVLAGALGPADTSAQTAVFRSRTDLVVLQVAVLDQQHHFVRGLKADDFAVYEEGLRQNILLFASSEAPLDLMVLIDTSSSMMNGRLSLAQDAAIKLLGALRPDDRAAVVLFSSSVRVAHGFTNDVHALASAVRGASPGGATALYEAMYVALGELSRARRDVTELRRQALVVLSDGEDTSSRGVSFDDLLEDARRRGVTMFTILPSPPEPDPQFDPRGRLLKTRFQMRQLAEATGGRAFTPASFDQLGGIYDDIAAELGQQYFLAYMPATAVQAGFRRVLVRLDTRPLLSARTRSGYYASGTAGGRPRS
jgi:Ca-activated chloride channel family protein